MRSIQVLSQNTINQIAAGEVIERPASVVKELVENAIDASASAITVEIKEGGIDFIRITDNGSGIEKDEIKTAFLRHATSKIRTTEDLLTIGSLGFRGEALASIASVSKVEVITKTAEPMTGVRYIIEGGEESCLEEVGCPEGTTFIVRSLFYNTPARRKFLKSKMTEAGYISTMMERIALSHPEVAFKLIHQNKAILHTTGSGRLKDVIYQIYGKEMASNLLPVEVCRDAFSIEGYIGKPVISRGNRSLENYFVNGRYIRNPIISKAIEDGYKTRQMVHKYPFTSLNLTIEPELLDVNVHPSKLEVRFKNGEEIFSAFLEGVQEALKNRVLIPSVQLVKEKKENVKKADRGAEPFEKKRIISDTEKIQQKPVESKKPVVPDVSAEPKKFIRPVKPMEEMLKEESRYEVDQIFDQKTSVDKQEEKKEEHKKEKPVQLTFLEEDIHTPDTKKEFHVIGQLFDTYWLLQKGDELLIMDQHAAHEKVLYEKLMNDYRSRQVYQQQVLPPVVLNLSLKEQDFVKKYEDLLKEFGFSLEEFGQDAYCIRAVPANLFGIDAQVFFRELLDTMEEEVRETNLNLVLDRIATMACKAAIKANQKLSVKEAEELLLECEKLENPYTCPHGRPVLISMSKKEIEKKFKRIV